MKPSVRIVVADSGPLIALARLIACRGCLRAFSCLKPVLNECEVRGVYPEEAPIHAAVANGWISPVDDAGVESHWNLGAGETSAIALGLQHKAGVLIDDQAARRMAARLDLAVIGTAGLLVLAKRKGLVAEVAPLLNTLCSSGYFLSADLMATILRHADEG